MHFSNFNVEDMRQEPHPLKQQAVAYLTKQQAVAYLTNQVVCLSSSSMETMPETRKHRLGINFSSR